MSLDQGNSCLDASQDIGSSPVAVTIPEFKKGDKVCLKYGDVNFMMHQLLKSSIKIVDGKGEAIGSTVFSRDTCYYDMFGLFSTVIEKVRTARDYYLIDGHLPNVQFLIPAAYVEPFVMGEDEQNYIHAFGKLLATYNDPKFIADALANSHGRDWHLGTTRKFTFEVI